MPSGNIERRAVLAILSFTFVWGCTFVWMKEILVAIQRELGSSSTELGLLFYLALRFGLAAPVLLVCVPACRRGMRQPGVWRGGLVLGTLLLLGFVFQLLGLRELGPAVSAFLTSLYVLFTALLTLAISQRMPRPSLVLGVVLATFGAGYIGGPPELTFDLAEFLTVVCAFFFAVHILATDRITRRLSPLGVTFTSLVVVTAGSVLLLSWLWAQEVDAVTPRLLALVASPDFARPLLLSCLLATVLAISLMNVFQRELPPVRAAILYALEPVWAALVGWVSGLSPIDGWLVLGGVALLVGNLVVEIFPPSRTPTPPRGAVGASGTQP